MFFIIFNILFACGKRGIGAHLGSLDCNLDNYTFDFVAEQRALQINMLKKNLKENICYYFSS